MIVCHITSVHKSNDVRIFIKQCQSLVNHGYETHFIVPNGEAGVFKGVQVHGIEKKNRNRLTRMLIATRDIYKKAIEIDADVYHFHDPELIPLGKKLAKKGKKVIYDVHEDVPRQIMGKAWIPKPLRKMVSYIFDKYEKNSVSNFAAVVTATPFITKMFRNSHDNIVDIKNYPILKELSYEKNTKKKLNQFVYVGGITTNRGINNMINSIAMVEGGQLALAGKFASNELEIKSKQLNGWKDVNYVGFVDREEINQLLGESIAGLVILHPAINYIDSLPIKMFEYMAAGIPVIASNFPLWKEIIEKNECGICVDPLDNESISNAMQYLIDNPDIARKMGENGRMAVENKYNWETEAERLIDLYNNL